MVLRRGEHCSSAWQSFLNAVSRQKQLITVFVLANAQKQGAIEAECIEATSATMFQELEQNAQKQGAIEAECIEATSATMFQELEQNAQKQGEQKENS